MQGWLDRLRRGRRAGPAPFGAPIAPDEPLAVIGDVHGRDDLLGRLAERVEAEAPGRRVVLVGDLIDRGERSADVLRRAAGRPDWVVLMGNHEAMMIEFLDRPGRSGPQWLYNGGLQTLASFGVGGVSERSRGEALDATRDALARAMGPDLIAWLRDRPLSWRSGNVAVTHAGGDPGRALDEQDEDALLWGHPDLWEAPRRDGIWMAHGHVILPAPLMERGRIGVDTGAFATGRLTAALIDAGGVRFVST